MLDFQILLTSLRALQASAFLAAMYFVDASTQDLMYFKSPFRSSTIEALVRSGGMSLHCKPYTWFWGH